MRMLDFAVDFILTLENQIKKNTNGKGSFFLGYRFSILSPLHGVIEPNVYFLTDFRSTTDRRPDYTVVTPNDTLGLNGGDIFVADTTIEEEGKELLKDPVSFLTYVRREISTQLPDLSRTLISLLQDYQDSYMSDKNEVIRKYLRILLNTSVEPSLYSLMYYDLKGTVELALRRMGVKETDRVEFMLDRDYRITHSVVGSFETMIIEALIRRGEHQLIRELIDESISGQEREIERIADRINGAFDNEYSDLANILPEGTSNIPPGTVLDEVQLETILIETIGKPIPRKWPHIYVVKEELLEMIRNAQAQSEMTGMTVDYVFYELYKEKIPHNS